MLALERVSYRYAGYPSPSITNIDLSLRDGEVVGLVGASESGKSTVCLVASGLAPRTIRGTLEGRLLINGEDARSWPMHQLAGSVGIGFQEPRSQLSGVCGTVYEEVAFGSMNLGRARDEIGRRTDEALATLRIGDLASRDPSTLSGGQMQLVALAGLLATGPSHLLLDEPTAQLDPAGTALVSTALAQLAASGVSILLAEQKTDLVASICTRVLALQGGGIALQGPAEDVLSDPRLPGLGIPEPSPIRLRRLVAEAGLDPAVLVDRTRGSSDGTSP
jgi:energy-coupling factor transporter ATP-binding protein EcfA2